MAPRCIDTHILKLACYNGNWSNEVVSTLALGLVETDQRQKIIRPPGSGATDESP